MTSLDCRVLPSIQRSWHPERDLKGGFGSGLLGPLAFFQGTAGVRCGSGSGGSLGVGLPWSFEVLSVSWGASASPHPLVQLLDERSRRGSQDLAPLGNGKGQSHNVHCG